MLGQVRHQMTEEVKRGLGDKTWSAVADFMRKT